MLLITIQDALYSYLYAKNIIKGIFEHGENTIKQFPHYSYCYAKDVIKDRWEKGENAISQQPASAYLYARDVIKGKLPENMHNKMICFGITDPNNNYAKEYFEFINEKAEIK